MTDKLDVLLELTRVNVLNIATVDYESLSDTMSDGDKQNVVSMLNRLAQQSVLLAEYLDGRTDGADHKHAAKNAVKTLNKVRKAMGYTYPQSFTF